MPQQSAAPTTAVGAGAPGAASPEVPAGPILLYDGVCAFCNGTVQFILRRDRNGTMRFAPLQGDTARPILDRHAETRGADSLILVLAPNTPQEAVLMRTAALLEIARYLGGSWRAASLARLLPRGARDWAYAQFARVRYRLFGRLASCPLPTPEQRERFLP